MERSYLYWHVNNKKQEGKKEEYYDYIIIDQESDQTCADDGTDEGMYDDDEYDSSHDYDRYHPPRIQNKVRLCIYGVKKDLIGIDKIDELIKVGTVTFDKNVKLTVLINGLMKITSVDPLSKVTLSYHTISSIKSSD